MLTILEQLTAAQSAAPKEHIRKISARERTEVVFRALSRAGSARVLHLCATLGEDYKHTSVKVYLRALVKEGRVTSRRSGNTTWYTPKKEA